MPKTIRDKMVKIRASAQEKSAWESKAQDAGISVANLIRRLLNTKEVDRVPLAASPRKFTATDPKLIAQVSKIGNNINQIAKILNQSRLSNSIEIIELMEQLLVIERQVRAVSKK